MRNTDNPQSKTARAQIAAALNAVVADAIDLHGRIKTAHWNLRGPLFMSLHPFFDQFAADLATHIDALAERTMTLGGVTDGTAAAVVAVSRLPVFKSPKNHKDREYGERIIDSNRAFVAGLHAARRVPEGAGDPDTVDMLTAAISLFEKHGWFLRSTLDA